MCACRRERGSAIVMMLSGEACGVAERGPGTFNSFRIRNADACRKDVPE